jgi:hypothetical protein
MKKTLIIVSLVVQDAYTQRTFHTISPSNGTKVGQTLNYKNGGDIIWQDDFSDQSRWSIETKGQGTFKIGSNNHLEISNANTGLKKYMGEMSTTGTTASNGFAFFNGVQYIVNASVDPQDTWIQSELIDLSNYKLDYVTLSFNQRYKHFNIDSTFFELSEDGGQNWVSMPLNEDVAGNTEIQNTILELIPTQHSSTTMIRFRWKCNSENDVYGSGYGWMVDDVKLIEPYSDELFVSKAFTNDIVKAYDYYSTPLSQVSPMKYGAIVQNLGGNASTKYLKFEVKLNNDQKFLDSTEISLNPGEIDTFWLSDANVYTPNAIGTYSLRVYLEDAAIQTNNSILDEFAITQHIYGHNYPTTGNLTFGFNDVNEEIGIGNLYTCFKDQQLNGIQVQFGEGTKADTYVEVEFKEVLNFNIQDKNNPYLGGTYYTIPSPVNTSTPTDIIFSQPIQLKAGKTYMVVLLFVQSKDANVRVKATSKGNDDLSTIGYGPFAEDKPANYFIGWSASPYVSLNFDPKLNVNDLVEDASTFTINPNPSSGETNISYNFNSENNISIELFDFMGKKVSSISNNESINGKNMASFDASNLTSGIYSVIIKTDRATHSRKFIKK